ncbi:putative origin recognition complex subunit protein [Zalerion maritima]|uniref:Origin recognition complex subunit protein n=1 Tax=Zalerion maritima TaxID=339359 RepID=A0AAD5WUH5_9PEZI|nr:putative origin recognition complex subunit protein [Zalerion maritima]
MVDHEAIFAEQEHQAAYIFEPEDDGGDRTRKRRKLSKRRSRSGKISTTELASFSAFPPLLVGKETEKCCILRQQLFTRSWSRISASIRRILREANQSTLDHVAAFVCAEAEAASDCSPGPVIPAAFILTGPNIASQDLLFDQLDESLNAEPGSKAVRLRSTDAPNLKAALKKIIQDVISHSPPHGIAHDGNQEGDPDMELALGGRRYLDYDLDALHSHAKSHGIDHVTIALQDSEAFDTSLISDLVLLFKSWIGRLTFILVFGVATSVDLFQARLPRSTCQSLQGDQFDVAHSSQVLDNVFKIAIASSSVPLRLGPNLLRRMVDRQHDQVAGIHVFASSVKYAYMCHFYANPLSILLADAGDLGPDHLQPEHLEAIRNLPSYRRHVEELVESGRLATARALLTDDVGLAAHAMEHIERAREWATKATRALALFAASSLDAQDFTTHYIEALSGGLLLDGHSELAESIKRMSPDQVSTLMGKAINILERGDEALGLPGWSHEVPELLRRLKGLMEEVEALQGQSQLSKTPLRSKYSAQSRVLRTTVIAQKVQLSQDVSTLTSEDKAYTQLVEQASEALVSAVYCRPPQQMFLSEAWLFDSTSPSENIFIPQPGPVVEKALAQPQDYLSCSCCSNTRGELNMATAPTMSVLYHLYLDAGPLINVADLWTAFYGLVGSGREDGTGDEGLEEREALVLFYRGLAELRAMGFVKATKKKADHIAKLKHIS